ncbi:PAS domain S-box protein [Flavobacterium sp.]|jgi:PAS domain S-box-containing protein|uniref:PAS domain S-box protein n=1 Tax=Flavobacterium sp. TaxID=239 RepID=UPI0037C0CD8F
MKISLENKILIGFIVNLVVVIASGWIFITRLDKQRNKEMDTILDWIELSLFGLSIVLLVIVYFIIQSQLKAKNISQKLLSDNKQLLQSIIDNTSNPIFIKEINGQYLLINKQYESLFHISNEEIIGKTDYDFLTKEVADAYRNSDLEVVKALRELKTEETIEQPDGRHIYIAVKFPLYDADGRVYAIGGISTDITERKKMEESLKEAVKFFNMSFDILTVAKDEHFIKINPALTKTLGYDQEDMNRIKFMDLIHPDDSKIANEVLASHLKGNPVAHFRTRFLCKDGTHKWLDWNSNIDMKQGVFYSVARDVTELVQLEMEKEIATNELYQDEEKLRLIVENIGEGIIVANANKKIILANDMANTLFGIKEDDKISSNFVNHFEVYFPDQKTVFPSQNLPMERAFNGEATDDIDVMLWDPNKQEKKRVLISGRPLVDQNNNVVAAVVTIKDISKYKQLEEELKETELKYRQLIGYKTGSSKES